MDLILFPLLGTRSRRAIQRRFHRPSQRHRATDPYHYSPRMVLLESLANQTGMTLQEIVEQLNREREYLLSQEI
jgi:hypothetical protein